MKNIVFVIESLQCGGAEKSLVTLLQNLDYKKFNVDLLLIMDGGDFQKFLPSLVNVTILDLFPKQKTFSQILKRLRFYVSRKVNKGKYHKAQLYWENFNNSIDKFNKNYDVAIAFNQGFATYYVAEKIAAQKKYSWLNTDYKKAGYCIDYDIKFYSVFDKVICVSEENEGIFKSEVENINKNIDTQVIKDITDDILIKKMSVANTGFEKEKNTLRLLTVGRLADAKGYDLAITACKILIDNGIKVKWYIIGEGPKRKELEVLIQENNLKNNFILMGFNENPYPYIKSCDIYVQTSYFEGLPLTVREAAILLKPIVTTNYPSASKIIDNNATGIICEMTAIDIANAIERYINDLKFKQLVIKNLSLLDNFDKETSLNAINDLLFN